MALIQGLTGDSTDSLQNLILVHIGSLQLIFGHLSPNYPLLPIPESHFIESWFYSAKVLKYLPQIYFQRRKTPLLVSVWPPFKHGFGIFNIHRWQMLYVKVGFRCAKPGIAIELSLAKHCVPYHRDWVFILLFLHSKESALHQTSQAVNLRKVDFVGSYI